MRRTQGTVTMELKAERARGCMLCNPAELVHGEEREGVAMVVTLSGEVQPLRDAWVCVACIGALSHESMRVFE